MNVTETKIIKRKFMNKQREKEEDRFVKKIEIIKEN